MIRRLTVLLLIVGCSKEPINYETTLIERDGLYTNWYENGQKRDELTYKDGKFDGLYTNWYENGQKRFELTYKDGIHNGLLTWWYDNGQKESEGIYKNNKLEGLSTHWYDNGQKWYELTIRMVNLMDYILIGMKMDRRDSKEPTRMVN